MICDISTSQDRYVTGPNDSRENPFGDGSRMLHDWMFDLATDDLVRSVLVSVEGQTTVAYFHKRKPTEHAHVWSVTKSVISILIGIAVDEGRLRVEQTLRSCYPDANIAIDPLSLVVNRLYIPDFLSPHSDRRHRLLRTPIPF